MVRDTYLVKGTRLYKIRTWEEAPDHTQRVVPMTVDNSRVVPMTPDNSRVVPLTTGDDYEIPEFIEDRHGRPIPNSFYRPRQ